jgi:hypothetical protein
MSSEQPPYDKDFQKGFNDGYIIAKHLPELADQLAKVESISPQIEGFKNGRIEFLAEKVREKNQPIFDTKDIGNTQSKSKDDKEFNKE